MSWNNSLPSSATTVSGSCDAYQKNWEAISEVFLQQHKHITNSTSPHHSAGEVSVFMVNTHAYLEAMTPVVCAFGYDTTYKVMVGWLNGGLTGAGGFVPSGTEMIFYQDMAPTGWIIKDTLDDKLVYITKGSGAGGETGGGTLSSGSWYLSGESGSLGCEGHAITGDELPSHRHSYLIMANPQPGHPAPDVYIINWEDGAKSYTTNSVGGGLPHKHDLLMTDQWRPDAYNCIVCTKI